MCTWLAAQSSSIDPHAEERLHLRKIIRDLEAEIIKKYLVVIDDLELAFKNCPTSDDCKGWVDGIKLIYQKVLTILEGEGVEVVPADGEFNPNIHEAISQIDHPEFESGRIVEVMRKGYKIGERIIRPSLVIVAR